MTDPDRVRQSYNQLAAEYSRRLFDELDEKPFDRALLDQLAARSDGSVCDLGCGPGHVARYLAERGAEVYGVDLSPVMIEEARRRNPQLRFEVGDLASLPFNDGSFAAAVAMYSLIHLDEHGLATACGEIRRVLAPQGLLLAAFHRGPRPCTWTSCGR
jgi:SAM-dependent methyltransferase